MDTQVSIPIDWRRPTAVESYTLHWDDKAQYGQILPRPSAEIVPSFYEVEEYYTHGVNTSPRRVDFWQRLIEHLAWRFDRGEDPDRAWWKSAIGQRTTVIEVGCGDGTNLTMLRELGCTVVGVEPDPVARERALEAGIEVYDGTAEALPTELVGQQFDVVVFMHVLEHCLDPLAAIANARSMLKPGGICVVEVPNNRCRGASHFGAAWYWLDVPRHLNFFSGMSLKALLAAGGMRPESLAYRGYARQFQRSWTDVQENIARLMRVKGAANGGRLTYWWYLLITALSPRSRKYDSVRVVAARD